MTNDDLKRFSRDGGLVIDEPVVDASMLDRITATCEPLLAASGTRRPGVRRVLEREPRLHGLLVVSGLMQLIRQIGGPNARIVRSILFDKTPDTNWLVPWHQDPTIAVRERNDVEGFGPWAIKDGEHHCQPPLSILTTIFTLRLHLDACRPDNGPLRVVVGSHTHGLLSDSAMADLVRRGPVVEACTQRGGVALMTPLSVHSSPKATGETARRRVLHLECSAADLPNGLQWAEASNSP